MPKGGGLEAEKDNKGIGSRKGLPQSDSRRRIEKLGPEERETRKKSEIERCRKTLLSRSDHRRAALTEAGEALEKNRTALKASCYRPGARPCSATGYKLLPSPASSYFEKRTFLVAAIEPRVCSRAAS